MLAYAYPKMVPPPTMPPGLVELMEDLTKEVLRNNPTDVYDFCAHHMQKLLEIRDGCPKKKQITLEQRIARARNNILKKIEDKYQNFFEIPDQGQEDILEPETLSASQVPSYQEQSHKKDVELESEIENADLQLVSDKNVQEKDIKSNIDARQNLKNEIKAIASATVDNSHDAEVSPVQEGYSSEIIKLEELEPNPIEITKNKIQTENQEILGDQLVKVNSPSENVQNTNVNTTTEADDLRNLDTKIIEAPINAYFTETALIPDFKDVEIDLKGNTQLVLHSVSNTRKAENIIAETHFNYSDTTKRETRDDFEKEVLDSNTEVVNTESYSELILNQAESFGVDSSIMNNKKSLEEPLKPVEDSVLKSGTVSIDTIETDEKREFPPVTINTEDTLIDFVSERSIIEASDPNAQRICEDLMTYKILTTKESPRKTEVETNPIVQNSSIKEHETDTSLSNENNAKENISVGMIEPTDELDVKANEDKTTDNVVKQTKTDEVCHRSINTETDNFFDLNDKQECLTIFSNSIVTNGSEILTDKKDQKTIEKMSTTTKEGKIEKTPNSFTENNLDSVQIEDNPNNSEPPNEPQNEFKAVIEIKKTSKDEKSDFEPKVMDPESITQDDDIKEYDVSNDKSDLGSTVSDSSGTQAMDLETAAITIQKVFRNFMFKSRASTFDDAASDESNALDKDFKEDEGFSSSHQPVKDRRPPGLGRMDTMLQTVNEEKSLSLSTDDSSTMSSAATIIQAHVRGFLARNKWNSSKTISSNSLHSSNPASTETLENKSKTILNIHIVPENGHFISRDDSVLASMDLSLDGSPPTSTNLHPLSFDVSERRKLLKREDAIQSISPPSNNSGKLSVDVESIKELPLNESDNTHKCSKVDLTANQYYDNSHNNADSEIKGIVPQSIDDAIEKVVTHETFKENSDEHKTNLTNIEENNESMKRSTLGKDHMDNILMNRSVKTVGNSNKVIAVENDDIMLNTKYKNSAKSEDKKSRDLLNQYINKGSSDVTMTSNNEGGKNDYRNTIDENVIENYFDENKTISLKFETDAIQENGQGIDSDNFGSRKDATENELIEIKVQNLKENIGSELIKNETYQITNETDFGRESINSKSNELESNETTPTTSLTSDTVIEVKIDHLKKDFDISHSYHPTNDLSDVITPVKGNKNERPVESDKPFLLHSGEFHDVVLPTKVSRNDTSVIRGE